MITRYQDITSRHHAFTSPALPAERPGELLGLERLAHAAAYWSAAAKNAEAVAERLWNHLTA